MKTTTPGMPESRWRRLAPGEFEVAMAALREWYDLPARRPAQGRFVDERLDAYRNRQFAGQTLPERRA